MEIVDKALQVGAKTTTNNGKTAIACGVLITEVAPCRQITHSKFKAGSLCLRHSSRCFYASSSPHSVRANCREPATPYVAK